MNNIEQLLQVIYKEDQILTDYPMAEMTTFKIGGPADFIVLPNTKQQIIDTIKQLSQNQIPFLVIGRGSNLLISDKGISGVVINTSKALTYCNIEDDTIVAGAGISLAELSKHSLSAGLAGLEFAAGIPGTVGGAVAMNAGAYGGEIKDIINSALVINNDGKTNVLKLEELELGYRKSIVQDQKLTVLEATFQLEKGDAEESKQRIQELANKRKTKQPLDKPSAGSVFKRPEGYFAGKLIQDAGLKGKQIGGAQVSTKHSGFIVNTGNATAKDVEALIKYIQQTVKDKFGVYLETELKMIGR